MPESNHPSDAFRSLIWLDDAPLFIDARQVERFYDAVVQPPYAKTSREIVITKQSAGKVAAKLGLGVSASPGKIASFLNAFLDAELKASAEGEADYNWANESSESLKLEPITTPERQLKQLVTHYLANHAERLHLVPDAREEEWRSAESIATLPRALVFLDLPSLAEAEAQDKPATKLIPTAAEFEDGSVIQLFSALTRKNGERPPNFEEKGLSAADLRLMRKTYWLWFEKSFSAGQAVEVIEKAATEHGRIRWIDYRLPLTYEGDTLHLHITPAEQFDTGTFAYNFVKRGNKHGLRLVGTLRSEPDMNVLAIYDK